MILERMWNYTNNQKAPKTKMVWGENIKGLKISLKDTDCFSRSHVIDVSSGISRTKVFGKRRWCNLEAQCVKDVMSD